MKKLILLLLLIPFVSIGQGLEKEKLKSVVNTFFEGAVCLWSKRSFPRKKGASRQLKPRTDQRK